MSDDGGDFWNFNCLLWNYESCGGDFFSGEVISEICWGGILASIDYGVFELGIYFIVVDFCNFDYLYVVVFLVGVLEISDGGKIWVGCNNGMWVDYLFDLDVEWGYDLYFIIVS